MEGELKRQIMMKNIVEKFKNNDEIDAFMIQYKDELSMIEFITLKS